MSSPFVADVGGLPIDGGAVRSGHLHRVSGNLVPLADLRPLRAPAIGVYIDLRGAEEDRDRLRRWARRARVEYVSIPIGVAGGRDLMRRIAFGGGNTAGMLQLYRTIVDSYGAELAQAVAVIASGTPVAFGCAAGKDRTGVLAALVQSVLGVSDADIAASYVSSAPPVEALTAAIQEDYNVPSWLLSSPGARVLMGAEAPTILETLAHVRREHSSVESYLVANGLAEESITALRTALAA